MKILFLLITLTFALIFSNSPLIADDYELVDEEDKVTFADFAGTWEGWAGSAEHFFRIEYKRSGRLTMTVYDDESDVETNDYIARQTGKCDEFTRTKNNKVMSTHLLLVCRGNGLVNANTIKFDEENLDVVNLTTLGADSVELTRVPKED